LLRAFAEDGKRLFVDLNTPKAMVTSVLNRPKGISLLEIVFVIAILAVAAALIFPSYNYIKRKSEDGVCMSNLRSLHGGFSAYLQDNGFIWPQSPFLTRSDDITEDSVEAKWWFEQLKEYGPTRETWLCPSERGKWAEVNDPDHVDSSYVPSSFDETPNIAYRWSLQPWLIERGGFHDQGQANAIFPDGHIDKRTSPGTPGNAPQAKK